MAKAIEVVADGKPTAIQIRNVYYMFLYAWDQFTGNRETELQVSESTNLVELFVKVLLSGARRLMRRGLDRGYLEVVEETSSPRGRFIIGESLKRTTYLRGTTVCLFDELSPNLLHNQIIKATIKRLLDSGILAGDLAQKLRIVEKNMSEVADLRLSDDVFGRVKLTRNTRHYSLLMNICHLLHKHFLVGEGSGRGVFQNFLEDETAFHALFEKFVRNFYRREQNEYGVSASQVPWDVQDSLSTNNRFLPIMQTDIVLQSSARTLVIDTKYYNHVLIGRGAPKVQSGHLYQILTYLSQWEKSRGSQLSPDGILLYAKTAGEHVDLTYRISGLGLRVRTIDLNQPWEGVHSDLLAVLGQQRTDRT
jgi:5-methylcytosine-specific restriction enzyme subunit McrC